MGTEGGSEHCRGYWVGDLDPQGPPCQELGPKGPWGATKAWAGAKLSRVLSGARKGLWGERSTGLPGVNRATPCPDPAEVLWR